MSVKIRYWTSISYTAPIWALSSHLSLGHATSLFPERFIVSHLEGSYVTSSQLLRAFLCTKFKTWSERYFSISRTYFRRIANHVTSFEDDWATLQNTMFRLDPACSRRIESIRSRAMECLLRHTWAYNMVGLLSEAIYLLYSMTCSHIAGCKGNLNCWSDLLINIKVRQDINFVVNIHVSVRATLFR